MSPPTSLAPAAGRRPRPRWRLPEPEAGTPLGWAVRAVGRTETARSRGADDRGIRTPRGRLLAPLSLAAPTLTAAAATVAGRQALAAAPGPAGSSPAVDQPVSPPVPPVSPGQQPSPLLGGLAMLALSVGLVAMALWIIRRRPNPRPERDPPASLLPKARWGATPHEHLHDARYLGRLLAAELNDHQQQADGEPAVPARPIPRDRGELAAQGQDET